MALDSYNDLVTEVADWLNRDDVTSSKVDTFIKLVEQDFFRRLRAPLNEKQVSIVVDTVTTTYTLPADFIEVKELNNTLSDAPPLERISLQDFKSFGAVDSGATAWPVYFARDYDKLVFYPITGENTLSFTYYFLPAALTSSNTSNEVLSKAPDLYLFGCLAMAEFWLKLEQPRFGPLYESALSGQNDAGSRAEYSGSTLTIGTPYG